MKENNKIIIPKFYEDKISTTKNAINVPSYLQGGVTLSCYECQSCENPCQASCQYGCMTGYEDCSTGCESTCEIACQDVCMEYYQWCGSCEDNCEEVCETYAECDNCEMVCMSNCESSCESEQCSTCETSCQSTCELNCQNCQSACESEQSTVGAKIRADSKGYHDIIQVDLYSLQFPANNYQQFRVEMYIGSTYIRQETWSSSSSSYETSTVFENLSPSTTYTFKGYATAPNGTEYAISGTASATTSIAPPLPPTKPSNFRITNTTMYTISLAWDASNRADYYQIYIEDSPTGQYGATVTGTTWHVDGLNEDSLYHFQVTAYNDGGASDTARISGRTESFSRPSNWTWDNTTSSSGNTLYVMPATKWNDFTARINEFRQYKGKSNYSFTSVGSGTKLTATIYNQAVSAINEMVSTDKLPLLTSSIRIPEDLELLRKRLNSIP